MVTRPSLRPEAPTRPMSSVLHRTRSICLTTVSQKRDYCFLMRLPAMMARTAVHHLVLLVADNASPGINDGPLHPARAAHRRRTPIPPRRAPTRGSPTRSAPSRAWRRAPSPTRRRRWHSRAVIVAKVEAVSCRAGCASGKPGSRNQSHRERCGKSGNETPVKHGMALLGARGPSVFRPTNHLERMSTPSPLNRP